MGERKEKYFTIKIEDKDVTVSIDRWKPVYLLQIPDVTTKQTRKWTGQPVKFPADLPPKVKKLSEKQSRKGRAIKLPVLKKKKKKKFWYCYLEPRLCL